MGLYEYGRSVNDYKHYESINYELPMTLSLFNTYDEHVQNVFTWVPDEDQWWITGFNPAFKEPVPSNMCIVSSVDFSGQIGMYNDFKNSYVPDDETLIFDDALKTIWIMWQ